MVEFCELCVIFLSTPSARRATFNKVHKTNLKYISIHALCEEGDKFATHTSGQLVPFLSTPSARRATGALYLWYTRPQYFYPRPLRGGRPTRMFSSTHRSHFYPRPLRGGRPSRHAEQHRQIRFLSTPSARRATELPDVPLGSFLISIHALCEEGDPRCPRCTSPRCHFYPRPLRGGRHAGPDALLDLGEFLSTPSARRATWRRRSWNTFVWISIHALCEEGDMAMSSEKHLESISIHALCEEGDAQEPAAATEAEGISIHALCEEGDREVMERATRGTHFYPRPLRGGRLPLRAGCKATEKFLSTPSARRATRADNDAAVFRQFLSTPSARRATQPSGYGRVEPSISIHALCEEGDSCRVRCWSLRLYFYPRPLRGGRPDTTDKSKQRMEFLSTPSARRATR